MFVVSSSILVGAGSCKTSLCSFSISHWEPATDLFFAVLHKSDDQRKTSWQRRCFTDNSHLLLLVNQQYLFSSFPEFLLISSSSKNRSRSTSLKARNTRKKKSFRQKLWCHLFTLKPDLWVLLSPHDSHFPLLRHIVKKKKILVVTHGLSEQQLPPPT